MACFSLFYSNPQKKERLRFVNPNTISIFAKNFATKNFAMKNPFKFGTVVEEEFFTDRQEELQYICRVMDSENHLALISPRRFGKSSLVLKAVKQLKRPYIMLNMQSITSTKDLSNRILEAVLKLYPMKNMKVLLRNFRIVPTISTNPMTNNFEVSFNPFSKDNNDMILEDVLQLVNEVSTEKKRVILIFDEFQEIKEIEKGLDKKLRGILQLQGNVNCIFLGSQESMMEEIFNDKKSPFYHFGLIMRLKRIPENEFFQFLNERFSNITSQSESISHEILQVTHCHPYYTQQLAFQVWDAIQYQKIDGDVVNQAINQLVQMHDLDFERFWINLSMTDRNTLILLAQGKNPMMQRELPSSTSFSSLKRLTKNGYTIKTDTYEIEDPFFQQWIQQNLL